MSVEVDSEESSHLTVKMTTAKGVETSVTIPPTPTVLLRTTPTLTINFHKRVIFLLCCRCDAIFRFIAVVPQ